MSVVETLLVFVGAPLVVVGGLAVLVFRPGGRKRPRYKPGQPWEYPPIWYEPHPEHAPAASAHAPSRAHAVATRLAIGQRAPVRQAENPQAAAATGGPRGGARGTW